MKESTKQKCLAVFVLILLAIVAFAILYNGGEGDDDPDIDIVGKWYLVDSVCYDEGARLYTTVNDNMNMEILGVKENGKLFYGNVQTNRNFENGTEFTGAFVEKNIIFQYETEYGNISAIGNTNSGNLVMKEIHYYDNTASPTWYVAVNTYSKSLGPVRSSMIDEPSINLSWTTWEGQSMNNTGSYNLKGANFYIHAQNGPFFRAEMEQTVGDSVVTKILNGVFINTYELKEGTMHMAYMVDSSGMLWNMYIRNDALILRSATLSELSEIEGQPVVIERVYRNASIAGPPGGLSSTSDILGDWKVTTQIDLYGNGEVKETSGARSIDYDEKNGTMFSGKGVYGEFEGQELAYSVVNKTISSGYLYHLICEYKDYYGEGSDYVSTGYGWLSKDGDTMYRVVFWTDTMGENGVTYYEFTE